MSRSNSKRGRKNPFQQQKTQLRIETLEDRALMSCTVISGFVYHDANNDGLYQPQTESPIPLSSIELRNANNIIVGTATTDANGFYKFEHDDSKPMSNETLTKTVTFPTTPTDFTLNGVLDQFDPALGELQSIEIRHDGAITSEIKYENVSSISTIRGTVSGDLTLVAPGVNDTLNVSTEVGPVQVAGFDGQINYTGPSGGSFGEQTASGTKTITLTGNAMNAYKGTGTVNVSETVVATSVGRGSGNINTEIRSRAGSTVTVVYHYKAKECLAPGDYKIIQTVEPPTFFDGKESKQGTVIPNTIGTDFINVTLGNIDLENNNFGELKSTRISGHVWHDEGNDGVRGNNEALIPGVTITLVGPNGTTTKTTDANGFYEFTDLNPGTYTVKETQPSNYLDGQDNAGSPGNGTVVNDPLQDQIKTITLAAGDNSQNNDFGEILPASIAGNVYYDADNDGNFDAGEIGISGVEVTLTGFDDEGPVNVTKNTGPNGAYKFDNLRPGTYAITEAQPGNYDDGKDTIGTPGGDDTLNDVFSAIDLQEGVNGIKNNFGEIKPDVPGNPLPKDVLPFGQIPYVSKIQATTVPNANQYIDPTLYAQLAFVVGTQMTLTQQQPNSIQALAAVNQLNSGVSQSQFVANVYNSDAHRAIQVNDLFQDVLNRAPTGAEQATAIASLKAGTSITALQENLYVSNEFQALHPGSTQLATALYTSILNATPGTQATQNLLQSMGNQTLNDVVHDLLTSNASLANMIDDAYHLVLRRAATASEVTTWTTPLKNGTMTLDQLTQRLLNSQEFYNLALANVH